MGVSSNIQRSTSIPLCSGSNKKEEFNPFGNDDAASTGSHSSAPSNDRPSPSLGFRPSMRTEHVCSSSCLPFCDKVVFTENLDLEKGEGPASNLKVSNSIHTMEESERIHFDPSSEEKDPVLLSVLQPALIDIIDSPTGIESPTWNYTSGLYYASNKDIHTDTETPVNPIPDVANGVEENEEEFGEDTEHIDFTALKGFLGVFRPNPNEDTTSNKNGKYVFYSLHTGLLRHHNLADVGRREGVRNLGDVMRSGPFWLDICNPSAAELRALCEIFKVHPLTLEGLESAGEEIREKCDVFEKYYFISIRAFDSDARSADYLLPINLYMLVSPSCVVTIHYDPLEFSHTIAKRMRLLTARTGLTSDWIVYTILEDVLEMFGPTIRSVENEVDEIEDTVSNSTYVGTSSHVKNGHSFADRKAGASAPLIEPMRYSQSEFLGRIAQARKRVTQLIRLMSAKSDLFRVIAKRCASRFHEDAHLYLRDLQDHTAMVDQTLHHYDESLNRSHANYLAHISIEISETSNTMNDVMKKLTAASTVTLPWTMFTGLLCLRTFEEYWAQMILLMTLASVAIYWVGRRRDWF